MSQIKITSIQPNGSFQYTQGPMAGKTGYGFIYTFEDGSTGRCVHLTEQPKFNVGDTVEVEEAGNDTQGNRKVKITKPGASFGGGGGSGGGRGGDNSTGQMVGAMMKGAIEGWAYGRIKYSQIAACARDFCKMSLELQAEFAPAPLPATPAQEPAQQPASQQQPQQPAGQPAADQYGVDDDSDDVPF
jgi:hypothetical protein